MSIATATAYRSRFAGRFMPSESRKSTEIKPFFGCRDTYSRKAHCIKDSVLLDVAAGTVLFLNGTTLHTGDVQGDVSEADLRRVQIRETIVSHFEKEQRLFARGIKTLSLFFIDEVAKYRQYDAEGNALLGEYGRIFEEEYRAVMNENRDIFDPAYMKYLDDVPVEKVHAGYFSIDKKTGRAVDSSARRGSDLSDDISAYDLILKDKERLLSFDEPTRVIFSHSALREGGGQSECVPDLYAEARGECDGEAAGGGQRSASRGRSDGTADGSQRAWRCGA